MMNKQNIHNLASAIDKLEASIEATEKKRQQNYDVFAKLTSQHDN